MYTYVCPRFVLGLKCRQGRTDTAIFRQRKLQVLKISSSP